MHAQADKLFQACANIIVFQSTDPEPLIVHAGTRLVLDYSQHRPGQARTPSEETPRGFKPVRSSTMRMQEKPKIDANQVRQLGKGEGFWIYQGRFQKMAVERLSFSKDLLETIRRQTVPLQPPPLVPARPRVTSTPDVSVTQPKPSSASGPTSGGSSGSSIPPAGNTSVTPSVNKKKGRGLFDA